MPPYRKTRFELQTRAAMLMEMGIGRLEVSWQLKVSVKTVFGTQKNPGGTGLVAHRARSGRPKKASV